MGCRYHTNNTYLCSLELVQSDEVLKKHAAGIQGTLHRPRRGGHCPERCCCTNRRALSPASLIGYSGRRYCRNGRRCRKARSCGSCGSCGPCARHRLFQNAHESAEPTCFVRKLERGGGRYLKARPRGPCARPKLPPNVHEFANP